MRTHRFLAAASATSAIAFALAMGGSTVAASQSSFGAGCDPNYTGDCVPIASDVDCADGEGDGPEYVEGPVTVVGEDKYGLDRDDTGVGCPNGDGSGGGGGGTGGAVDNGNGGGAGTGGGGSDGGGAMDGDDVELAYSGSTSAPLVGGAAAALVAGGLALLASRRRTA